MMKGGCIEQNLEPTNFTQYSLWQKITESQKLYAVAYNPFNRDSPCFAAVGGNMVTSYGLEYNYEDPILNLNESYFDEYNGESFYAVCWAFKEEKDYILAGGLNSIIRVIDYENLTEEMTLSGHDDEITDLQRDPRKYSLVLSASKDKSVRLWSIETGVCLLKCCGSSHELLSADFYLGNKYLLLSSGSDKCVRVWYTQGGWVKNWLNDIEFKTKDGEQYGTPIELDRVSFTSIECVRSLSSTLFSQIGAVGLIQWTLNGYREDKKKPILIFPIPGSGTSKFETVGLETQRIALGNQKGEVYVYDVASSTEATLITISSHRDSNDPIRHTAISNTGSLVVSINEKGDAYIWNDTVQLPTSTTSPIARFHNQQVNNPDPTNNTPSPETVGKRNCLRRSESQATVPVLRKRGRAKKDDLTAATVARAKKHGRKLKSEEAVKSVGRPKKDSSAAPVAACVREHMQKVALLQKKVKEAADNLDIALKAFDDVQKQLSRF